jgi:hypothetical protein
VRQNWYPNSYIHDSSLSWLRTGTMINSYRVKLMLCVQAFQCKYVKTVSITHNVSHPRLTININNIRRWCMFSVVVTNKKIVYISLITTKSNVLINNQRPSTVYTANMIYIGNEQIIFDILHHLVILNIRSESKSQIW